MVSTPIDFKGPAFKYSIQDEDKYWITDFCGAIDPDDCLRRIMEANPRVDAKRISITPMHQDWASIYKELCYN